ncbi:MAG: diacylglycerol kinase (ATP) [Myxococcota bacterium]
MEPWFTIINPSAAGGRCERNTAAALRRLKAQGLPLEIIRTRHSGHATALAMQGYDAGRRNFLSVGGDGTHFEVLNGIFPPKSVDGSVMGMLPGGTGNSFLRDFGITHLDDAVEAMIRHHSGSAPRAVDVVRVTHRDGQLHYINLLSVGFPASVGAMTNRRFKPLGTAGYVLSVLLSLTRLQHPSFKMCVDGDRTSDERPCTLLSFSNSRYTGGKMLLAPTADATDGEVDIVRVGPVGAMKLLRNFPRLYLGKHTAMSEYEHTRAKTVRFDAWTQPVDCMVDGEVVKLLIEQLDVLPQALKVVA